MSKLTVDWGDAESKAKKSPEILTLKIGNAFIVRPLGTPFAFDRAYINEPGKPFRNIIVKDAEEFESRTGIRVLRRYALNVYDRQDKTIKILQGPAGLFKHLMQLEMAEHQRKVIFRRPWWQRLLSVFSPQWVEKKWPSPKPYEGLGMNEGMEIEVRVTGEPGKPMTTRYSVTGARDTLTSAERDIAKVGMHDLPSIFKPTKDQGHPIDLASNSDIIC